MAKKGVPLSEAHKAAISAALKGRSHGRDKKPENWWRDNDFKTPMGIVYPTPTQALLSKKKSRRKIEHVQ